MVVPIREYQEWRTPRCGDGCRRVRAVVVGTAAVAWIEQHDIEAHDALAVAMEASEVHRVGPLVVDDRMMQATIGGGQPLPLSNLEYRLLRLLAAGRGRLVRYEEVVAALWPAGHFLRERDGRHAARVTLARLRARLGRHRGLIATRVGFGLMLREPAP